MHELILSIAIIVCAYFAWVWEPDSERVNVPPWMYEYADQQCEEGFRKITVTENAIGVRCRGGGLHVLDWGSRRVVDEQH